MTTVQTFLLAATALGAVALCGIWRALNRIAATLKRRLDRASDDSESDPMQ